MVIDLFDLAASWLDLLLVRRFIIPTAAGIIVALGVYYLTGQTPGSAAVAFAIAVLGIVFGVVWHIAGGSKPGAA
ncbi:MAG TPA: hypothetical protein VIG97_07000 [Luteimonas sp.]